MAPQNNQIGFVRSKRSDLHRGPLEAARGSEWSENLCLHQLKRAPQKPQKRVFLLISRRPVRRRGAHQGRFNLELPVGRTTVLILFQLSIE